MLSVTENDQLLIRYLLGELNEEERDHIENRYFADEGLHEELLAVEDELIDSYLRAQLSPEQLSRFHGWFLSSPERRRKLDFAKAFTRFVYERPPKSAVHDAGIQSLWITLLSRLRAQSQPTRLALLFAILLVVLLPVVILERIRLSSRLEQETNLRQTQQKSPSEQQSARATEKPSQTGQQQREPPPVAMLSFILYPLERSRDKGNTIVIPPGEYELRLQLDLEGTYYEHYRVTLQTAEGSRIRQLDGLKPQTTRQRGSAVFVRLPSHVLVDGDYSLMLEGVTPKGRLETADGYAFRVVKRSSKTH